jgi:hypothetical protein
MSADGPITVDDLKHQAERIRDIAKDEAKQVLQQDVTTYVIAGVVAVVVVVSVAYYLGSRASRRA